MKESAKFKLHTNLPATIFYLIEIPLYIYFMAPGKQMTLSMIPVWLGLSVLSAIVHNLLMRKHYKLAMTDVKEIHSDHPKMDEYLVSIGAMPLKNLALFVGIVLLYQGGFFLILSRVFGTDFAETGVFCGLLASMGLLAAGFIYISLDNYVIDLLFKKQITYFPTDKRINRQKAKAIIIPSYMTIMTFLVTGSLVLLSLMKTPGIPSEAINGMLTFVMVKNFIPQLVYLIIGLGLVFNSAVNISKLFDKILSRLEDMVSKDKNLTRRIYISSIDEMASIGRFINIFSELISEHIKETGEVYGNLDSNHKVLSHSINESSHHISDITELLDGTIESVQSVDTIVSASIETGKSLIKNVNDAVGYVESQSHSVEESSAAVEEMIASISEVSRRTELVKENTLRLAGSFGKGEESVKNTIKSISGVAELSQNILSVNKLISGIAAQTNLLAMNAAIEAAHAGDAGRGFSVVADEIRKLAENTSTHIKTSGESLNSILKEIQSSLKVAEETGVIFNEMKSGILHIQDESLSIADSMSEHDKANRQVLEQLVETKDIAGKLNSTADMLSTQSSSMMDAFRQLESNSESSLQNARIMMQRSSQIKMSVDELTDVAAATETINHKTRELITAFTID